MAANRANDIAGPRLRDTSADKWRGPASGVHSIADELQFDALPEETRDLAERVGAGRMVAAADGGYSMGYDDGKERGKEDAEDEFKKEKLELEEKLDRLTDDKDDLTREVEHLRQALRTIASAKVVNVADAAMVAKKALAA